jgi:hypothetical protein
MMVVSSRDCCRVALSRRQPVSKFTRSSNTKGAGAACAFGAVRERCKQMRFERAVFPTSRRFVSRRVPSRIVAAIARVSLYAAAFRPVQGN